MKKKNCVYLKHGGKGSYFIFMNNELSNVKHTQSYAYIHKSIIVILNT